MTRYYETTTTMTPGNLREVVRGQEHCLIDIMEPVVRRQSVTLDLGQIERIDAAGIAALISLYSSAHVAGHEFTIVNASNHVAEILALVGLDRILMDSDLPCPQGTPCYEMPAA
jgi:anti-anti-sigma factor